jgi:hypothetical protein
MMIKGGIRIGGLGISGFDADAAAYFERAGVTDATAKNQISAFVKGMKDLGLYSNMLSWPLRSAQNAGTGSTAYSLGGLQTANATLVNGDTWTANGTPFTTTEYANATISDPGQDLTLLLVAAGSGASFGSFPHFFGVQHPTTYISGDIVIGSNGGNANVGITHINSGGAQATTNITSGLSGATSFIFLSGSAKINTILNIKRLDISSEGSGTPVSAGTATLTRMQLNGRWFNNAIELGAPITCAFCAVIAPNINSSESSIYTLYKNTMGTGLGLP